jgi:hypothetical protein
VAHRQPGAASLLGGKQQRAPLAMAARRSFSLRSAATGPSFPTAILIRRSNRDGNGCAAASVSGDVLPSARQFRPRDGPPRLTGAARRPEFHPCQFWILGEQGPHDSLPDGMALQGAT